MISRRSLIAAPAAALLPACARAQPQVVRARLDRDFFFVEAKVAAQPGLFVIDTGAPFTVLDLAFARSIGAQPKDREVLTGAGGARAAWRAPVMGVSLVGGPTVRLTPWMTDLSYFASGIGAPMAGFVGCDLLGLYVLNLDYRAGRATLSDPRLVRAPPRASRMRFDSTPYVHATVHAAGRSVAAEFQIDTGSNTAVEFWRPFAQQAFPDVRVASGGVLGVAGAERSARGRVDSLVVDGLTISDLEANFSNETRPDDAGPAHGGIIGGPAWRGLSVTLDFPDRLFWAT
jgi:hypothetical protein